MTQKPLIDNRAHDALYAARQAFGNAPGATTHANAALETARRALTLLATALVSASVRAEEKDAKARIDNTSS
jgi:hypothetical protein